MSATPGPWRITGETYSDDAGVVCVEHPVYDAIDVLLPSWANSAKEHLDNARLIAAAPDLLATLIVIVGYLRGVERWPVNADHLAYLQSAELVIAQAEGRR